MSEARLKFATLDKARLEKLHALEEEMGLLLVAYEQKPQLADLSNAQLKKLQEAEKELGVVLVAYEPAL
ncbi:MAG: hypothetical protein JXB47_04275 [Anaerolineae bacterium]|nr:hypothetical protein [Anaerolineae bacterium]